MTSLATRSKPIEHDPTRVRAAVEGPEDSIAAPYPIYLKGWVEKGFGRGSKDLGCPTANLPDSAIDPYNATLTTGVYYGYATVIAPTAKSTGPDAGEIVPYPMVMSIGWNPFYDNDKRTAEVHVLHAFGSDFYGSELRVIILGFIRPEYNYSSLDALIKDINTDKLVAANSVARPVYATYATDPFLTAPSTLPPMDPKLMERRVDPRDAQKPEEVKL